MSAFLALVVIAACMGLGQWYGLRRYGIRRHVPPPVVTLADWSKELGPSSLPAIEGGR